MYQRASHLLLRQLTLSLVPLLAQCKPEALGMCVATARLLLRARRLLCRKRGLQPRALCRRRACCLGLLCPRGLLLLIARYPLCLRVCGKREGARREEGGRP